MCFQEPYHALAESVLFRTQQTVIPAKAEIQTDVVPPGFPIGVENGVKLCEEAAAKVNTRLPCPDSGGLSGKSWSDEYGL